MAPPSPPLPRPNDPGPGPVVEAAEEEEEEEETLTLLVLAGVTSGVTSLDHVRALVTSFVSTAGRQQQRQQQQGSAAASHPDLIVALGPFVVGGGEEEEEEEEEGALADEAAATSPLPPWQAAPLDRRKVEGRAAAEADATAALALLETAVCRLVYLPTAGVDPPSTTALGGQRPPPQLTPTSLNTHDAVVQLLPGLFVGGFAHAARTGAGEGGGGPLLDDDEGQRPRQEQEQQQHPCTAASERATARALRAVGRLVGRRQGEQQQRQQQQLIMLETFSAPLTAEGDIAGAGGGGDSGGDGGGSRGPFSLSPAFLAGAGIDPGEGEEGRCRLLLHVGFTHRRRKQRLTTAATPRPGEPAASATASPTATTKAQEEEEGEGPSPCAARYEDPSSNDGAAGPTLLAPGCFGAKGGSYALVRLGRGARGGRTGQGLWAVRDVAFERVR